MKLEEETSESKIDFKGRVTLPRSLRRELEIENGDTVLIKRTRQGLLIELGKRRSFPEKFREIIMSEPGRTGKPENWPPSRMKSIWAEA